VRRSNPDIYFAYRIYLGARNKTKLGPWFDNVWGGYRAKQ
jgi:hypothetical protein